MTIEKIRELVLEHYEKGYHCAESIYLTLMEIFNKDKYFDASCASGFCGGIGACHKGNCGALSGGVIALGSLYGRKKQSENIDLLKTLSVDFRDEFIRSFGSANCEDLLEKVNKGDYENCKEITAKSTQILYAIINEYEQ